MHTASRRVAIGTFLAAALLVPLVGLPPEEVAGPCVVVKRDGGSNPDRKSGLVLAVWEDGAMLFAGRSDQPGERLLVGQAGEEEVKAMLQDIVAAGFFLEKREHYAVPDSVSATIMVRKGKEKALHTWHEYLLPGFGGDINSGLPELREDVEEDQRCHRSSPPSLGGAARGDGKGRGIPWI